MPVGRAKVDGQGKRQLRSEGLSLALRPWLPERSVLQSITCPCKSGGTGTRWGKSLRNKE